MSLDDLARASGVSRAGLSQIESGKSNPTLGVLWKVAVGLGVPFSELLGHQANLVGVLRRADTQVLRSADGKMESRPITPAGASPMVEMYELRLSSRAIHRSAAHAEGTKEIIVVLSGQLRIVLDSGVLDLAAGDSAYFPADQIHAYENPGASEGRYHNVILYRR
jgi:transcriptional regulator with XRE-family HTH domain